MDKWSAVPYPGYDGESIIDRNRIKNESNHILVFDRAANEVRGLIGVPEVHL